MRRDLLSNILSDANYGIAYWCGGIDAENYEEAKRRVKAAQPKDSDGIVVFEDVLVEALCLGQFLILTDLEDPDCIYKVNERMIRSGFELARIKGYFVDYDEEGDSEIADVIIQLAIFGEIVYG